jgi:hypothetical protein
VEPEKDLRMITGYDVDRKVNSTGHIDPTDTTLIQQVEAR